MSMSAEEATRIRVALRGDFAIHYMYGFVSEMAKGSIWTAEEFRDRSRAVFDMYEQIQAEKREEIAAAELVKE
jgi:Mn-containing catalase